MHVYQCCIHRLSQQFYTEVSVWMIRMESELTGSTAREPRQMHKAEVNSRASLFVQVCVCVHECVCVCVCLLVFARFLVRHHFLAYSACTCYIMLCSLFILLLSSLSLSPSLPPYPSPVFSHSPSLSYCHPTFI